MTTGGGVVGADTVHPHMRGEYDKLLGKYPGVDGSSPHAWRICLAGQSGGRTHAVHPHMRGEYVITAKLIICFAGSSPHAWRICHCCGLQSFCNRFIPTCVENIHWRRDKQHKAAVHPHMRGEYDCLARKRGEKYGSSPHAWRICYVVDAKTTRKRFIPTCVENILPRLSERGFLGGSSPHAWRICHDEKDSHPLHRFIPTCVENILDDVMITLPFPVHPHMRGEYEKDIRR